MVESEKKIFEEIEGLLKNATLESDDAIRTFGAYYSMDDDREKIGALRQLGEGAVALVRAMIDLKKVEVLNTKLLLDRMDKK